MLLNALWLAAVLVTRSDPYRPPRRIDGADAHRAWRSALTRVQLLQLAGLRRRLEQERARRRAAG
ncbi:hypothetical protein [Roseisolibacter agri]|uniref:Uncharacterized protein n=1 Tax=Roseisolibacter agri TaxID=2014610 RepID=A0AA37VDJ1_9BACT|nr:hypothetical protein [Roseisolibacter agri]GLC23759.1 hypothetical protein rosag_02720 [Roseisolibacter agri]